MSYDGPKFLKWITTKTLLVGVKLGRTIMDMEDPDLGCYAALLSRDVSRDHSAFLFKVKQSKHYYSWMA
jgi:hypothetical protein